jgi:hypothetical protein
MVENARLIFRVHNYMITGCFVIFLVVIQLVMTKDEKMFLKEEFSNQRKYFDGKFKFIDEKFTRIDIRFEAIDERFERIEKRLKQMDDLFKVIIDQLIEINKKLDLHSKLIKVIQEDII